MCGIVGILNKGSKNPVGQAVLDSMAEQIRHRGPDDEGIYINQNCGLAHRRLSILDLTTKGRQPMSTTDGRYTIVFNGEIYNYRELHKKYLPNRKLNSSSDTEVLLHLLAAIGTDALTKLRGMFAFAFWDKDKQELLIARDAFGKKPLYYYQDEGLFIVASEIKSLLIHPSVPKEIDPLALTKHLCHQFVPDPATGYQAIKQLPAGSWAHVGDHNITIRKWWKPVFLPKLTFDSEKEAMNQLDELLFQAVRRRMVADVPVGVFLSGGLDSTVIAWYMKKLGAANLHSFSIIFPAEESYNEAAYAKAAAEALGTQQHFMKFTVEDFITTLNELKKKIDFPISGPNMLPIFRLSQLAKNKVTVVLTGEGSDELLAGYNTYRAAEITSIMTFMPQRLRKVLTVLAEKLPTQYTYSTLDSKIKTLIKGIGYSLPERNQVWLSAFTPDDLSEILTDPFRKHSYKALEDIDQYIEQTKGLSSLDILTLINIHFYLGGYLLPKHDRSTMFASLEARMPFLDTDLAEFIMRLPTHLKKNKYLLRKLMRGRIPDAIIDRPKRGLSLPLGQWLRDPLWNLANESLSDKNLQELGLVKTKYVKTLLTEHRQGKADHRKKIMTLVMLHLWHQQWINHPR